MVCHGTVGTTTSKWPVLDLGTQPRLVPKAGLRIDGAVEHPVTLSWKDLLGLPQSEDVSDFHCVTTWSKLDMHWGGVRFIDLAAHVQVKENATHILCHAYDEYTTNLSLEEALKPDVLLVHTYDGAPLARELRTLDITPHLRPGKVQNG